MQKNGARTAVAPALTLSRLAARHGLGEFAMVCEIEGAEAAMIPATTPRRWRSAGS